MKFLARILVIYAAFMAQAAHSVLLDPKDAVHTPAGSTWTYQDSRITFHGPDSPTRPIAWEGPLEITNKSGSKKFDIELPSELHLINNTLFIISNSGSSYYLDMINITAKSHVVKNKELNGNLKSINNNLITIEPGCECIENNMCNCTRAQVFSWNAEGLNYERWKSKELTEQLLGVCFKGTKLIPRKSIKMKL